RRQLAVTGSPSSEKQQRILFANRIGLFGLAKQIPRVSELRFELLAHFGSDFVAAAVDSTPDRRFDVLRKRTDPSPHFTHSLFDNALHRPPPTYMEDADGFLLGVLQNDRQAISRLD